MHKFQRSNIYEDFMSLFEDEEIAMKAPFQVEFIGEQAVDGGGLAREAFSAFWEEAYFKHFDGATLLKPVVNASLQKTRLHILGRILSYGYLSCGFLPVRTH